MKYKCENELHTLSFKDFNIDSLKLANDKFTIYTVGGIARYNNSCNEMLEERYISECEITFYNAEIKRFFLEGGKYYNADDVLISETPDTDFAPAEFEEKFRLLAGDGVIFFLSEKPVSGTQSDNSSDDASDNSSGDASDNASNKTFIYELAVDVEDDTYWINIAADKVSVSFDRFMNRVIN